MEQRRLRLGDILDDYCPRERRLTNHAVVAMIEDTVKQTRCTTCDAEHVYKGGKVPRRRKQETPAALYKEVLAGMPETESSPVLAAGHLAEAPPDETPVEPSTPPVHIVHAPEPPAPRQIVADIPVTPVAAETAPDASENDGNRIEEGPVHR